MPTNAVPIIIEADAVLLETGLAEGVALVVDAGSIAAIGEPDELRRSHPEAERLDLRGQVVMPGFVNAHQHGGGLKTFQLGARDDLLEPWLLFARGRAIDPYWLTMLAALDMIAAGVTSVVHANTAYASGDFTNEIRRVAQAYDDSGLRAMVGLGARDRGEVVYPDREQAAFIASLPADLREMIGDPKKPLYAGDAAATIRSMETLQAEFAARDRITFAHAPAGPQWVSDELLSALCEDAAARGVGVHMHGLESHAQAVTIADDCPEGFLAHLERLGVLSPRLSLAHAVWLTPDDAARAAAHGVTLVRNAGSNLRLRVGIAPLAQYIAAGVNVALGTDSMTLHDDEDLFRELRLAAGLARSPYWDGPAPPDAARMTHLTTLAGAKAMQLDARTGSIALGKRADLIGVSLERVRGAYLDPDIDLHTAIYARADGADVRLTMVDGRIAYRDGRFARFDRADVAARVGDAAARSRINDRGQRERIARLAERVAEHYRRRERRLDTAPWTPYAERVFGT